jgi:glycosyltransferase involved in cell wall biosynthesis
VRKQIGMTIDGFKPIQIHLIMNTSPLISVCLAVYNTEKYIAQAVESILNQTFEDFEFLIIDDGSTDKSPEILQSYAEQDQRIRFYHRENQGISKTRNQMLKQARGKFIAVMDADDIAYPERFEHQVKFLKNNPDVVCVGGAFEFIDEEGRFLHCLQPPKIDTEIQRLMLAGHTAINHPCAMIRRKSITQIDGYTEDMATVGDLDLFLRLGEVGKLANLEKTVLKYRLRMTSTSEQKQAQQTEDRHEACKRAWKRRGIKVTFEATEPWRPGQDSVSRYRFMLKYGWWAWKSRQRQTAIIYGIRAIKALPHKVEGWKLLACAVFKPFPTLASTENSVQ